MLSTCNRTEIYAVAEKFHGAYADVRDFLSELAYLPPEDFSDHLYVPYDEEAVRHLFAVASGLDSAVIGEAEILGQVRNAWTRAAGGRHGGPVAQPAVPPRRRGGQAGPHRDRHRPRHVASVSRPRSAMAAERLGSLEGRADPGAGRRATWAEGMVRSLAGAGRGRGASSPTARWDRAVALADRLGGRAVGLRRPGAGAARGGRVARPRPAPPRCCSSTATWRRSMAPRARAPAADRRHRRAPRRRSVGVATLDGVTLLDMDDLRAFAEAGLAERRREVRGGAAHRRRGGRLASPRWPPPAAGGPLVAALHDGAETIRTAELERFRGRLAELDDRQREAVEALTQGIVAKLLHHADRGAEGRRPAPPAGERLAEALRDLFDLE